MSERNGLVDVFPNPLVISKSPTNDCYESQLNLKNKTPEFIVVKIYNNKREYYSAKPSTSFLSPHGTTSISIKRFGDIISSSQVGGDKFLLKFYTINKAINSNEEAKEVFRNNEYNKNIVQDTMIDISIKNDYTNNFDIESTYSNALGETIENYGEDYNRGVQIFKDKNSKLKAQINQLNNTVENLEKNLQNIKTNKSLNYQKEMAIDSNVGRNKAKKKSAFHKSYILLILCILIGLTIGANLANGYNKIFKRNKNIKNEKKNVFNKVIVKGEDDEDSEIDVDRRDNNKDILQKIDEDEEDESKTKSKDKIKGKTSEGNYLKNRYLLLFFAFVFFEQ